MEDSWEPVRPVSPRVLQPQTTLGLPPLCWMLGQAPAWETSSPEKERDPPAIGAEVEEDEIHASG